MSTSYKMTAKDRDKLLSESINWRSCVEQIFLLLHARQDPELGTVMVELIKWLQEPKNIKKVEVRTLESIIQEMKGEREPLTLKKGASR